MSPDRAAGEPAADIHAPGAWVADLRLDPTAWIAPGAVVTGHVTLGPRASVWFHVVVRGDTAPIVVGAETNLQDLTVVHVDLGYPAEIGSRVTVGHRAIVHGCKIEDDCLIGMGAIVLTGARVGQGSLVAAGALVREGQEIPPGSLVLGAPARVAGPVTDAHRAAIRRGTGHYVELSRSYLARGFARPHPARRSDQGTVGVERGSMTELEWARLASELEAGPAEVERALAGAAPDALRRAPGPDRWSALEVLCHLRDTDLEVLAPRLRRMLEEAEPRIENVDMQGWDAARRYRDQDPAAVLAAWRVARAAAVPALRSLGPRDWIRFGYHSLRGPYTLADLARGWVEHDLAHRRQLAEALRAGS